jgi:hypothetical protein
MLFGIAAGVLMALFALKQPFWVGLKLKQKIIKKSSGESLPKSEIQPEALHPRFFSPLSPSKGVAAESSFH